MNTIREYTHKALEVLKQTDSDKIRLMQQRVNNTWASHEDVNRIQPSLVPIVIVGAKFDLFT